MRKPWLQAGLTGGGSEGLTDSDNRLTQHRQKVNKTQLPTRRIRDPSWQILHSLTYP